MWVPQVPLLGPGSPLTPISVFFLSLFPDLMHYISPAWRTIILRSFWCHPSAKSRQKKLNHRVTPYPGLFCK